jgi:hypothetical protein
MNKPPTMLPVHYIEFGKDIREIREKLLTSHIGSRLLTRKEMNQILDIVELLDGYGDLLNEKAMKEHPDWTSPA